MTADDIAGLELARVWREVVWRNAERLLNARSDRQRERVAHQIHANAAAWARGIAAVQTPGIRASRCVLPATGRGRPEPGAGGPAQ